MNNVIAFTLEDIGVFVLWGLAVIILYYLILILSNLYSTLKNVNAIVKDNRESIDKILEEAPGISKNANTISGEVSEAMIKFRGTIDNVAETSETVTGTIKDNNDINAKLTSIFHTLSIGKETYDKFFSDDKASKTEDDLS